MESTMEARELFVRLGDDELLVLDCREEEDWLTYQLHIPGALRMTQQDLVEASSALPDDELIVLCGTAKDGSDMRRAQRLLRLRGRGSVRLEGGLQGWVTGGYPVERHGRPLPAPRGARSQDEGDLLTSSAAAR